jgi:hypothetical protein
LRFEKLTITLLHFNTQTLYLVFARKLNILECLVRKRQVRGLRSAENKEFTFVNDWFLHERNEEIDVFWQALFIFGFNINIF